MAIQPSDLFLVNRFSTQTLDDADIADSNLGNSNPIKHNETGDQTLTTSPLLNNIQAGDEVEMVGTYKPETATIVSSAPTLSSYLLRVRSVSNAYESDIDVRDYYWNNMNGQREDTINFGESISNSFPQQWKTGGMCFDLGDSIVFKASRNYADPRYGLFLYSHDGINYYVDSPDSNFPQIDNTTGTVESYNTARYWTWLNYSTLEDAQEIAERIRQNEPNLNDRVYQMDPRYYNVESTSPLEIGFDPAESNDDLAFFQINERVTDGAVNNIVVLGTDVANNKMIVDTSLPSLVGKKLTSVDDKSGRATAKVDANAGSTTLTLSNSNGEFIDQTNKSGTVFFIRITTTSGNLQQTSYHVRADELEAKMGTNDLMLVNRSNDGGTTYASYKANKAAAFGGTVELHTDVITAVIDQTAGIDNGEGLNIKDYSPISTTLAGQIILYSNNSQWYGASADISTGYEKFPWNLTPGVYTYSMSCWVNPEQQTESYPAILALGGSGSIAFAVGPDMEIQVNKMLGGGSISSAKNVVPIGRWSHVRATRDTTRTVRFYVNGVEVGSESDTKTYSAAGGTGSIGAEYVNADNGLSLTDFKGKIQDVLVYFGQGDDLVVDHTKPIFNLISDQLESHVDTNNLVLALPFSTTSYEKIELQTNINLNLLHASDSITQDDGAATGVIGEIQAEAAPPYLIVTTNTGAWSPMTNNYIVGPTITIPSKIKSTDHLLVNRGGASFHCTGADFNDFYSSNNELPTYTWSALGSISNESSLFDGDSNTFATITQSSDVQAATLTFDTPIPTGGSPVQVIVQTSRSSDSVILNTNDAKNPGTTVKTTLEWTGKNELSAIGVFSTTKQPFNIYGISIGGELLVQ